MKLIVRGADYAMTDSITDGCLRAARCGILTDVGLMTNNAAQARYAVNELKKYPHVSVGSDPEFLCPAARQRPEGHRHWWMKTAFLFLDPPANWKICMRFLTTRSTVK